MRCLTRISPVIGRKGEALPLLKTLGVTRESGTQGVAKFFSGAKPACWVCLHLTFRWRLHRSSEAADIQVEAHPTIPALFKHNSVAQAAVSGIRKLSLRL